MSHVNLVLQAQEIPFDHPCSDRFFGANQASVRCHFTDGALEQFGIYIISGCLRRLQEEARKRNGIDYVQIFKGNILEGNADKVLWFIQDKSGLVTVLLPEEY